MNVCLLKYIPYLTLPYLTLMTQVRNQEGSSRLLGGSAGDTKEMEMEFHMMKKSTQHCEGAYLKKRKTNLNHCKHLGRSCLVGTDKSRACDLIWAPGDQ